MIHAHVLSQLKWRQLKLVCYNASQICPEHHSMTDSAIWGQSIDIRVCWQRNPTGHPLHLMLLRWSWRLKYSTVLWFVILALPHHWKCLDTFDNTIKHCKIMQNHKEIVRGHVFRLKLFHNARCATFIIPIKGVGRFPSYLPENKSSYDLKTTLILGVQSIPVPQHISIWVQLELHHRSPAKQLVQPFQEYLFATWPVDNISIQDTSISPTPKAQLFTNASTDCISSLNEASPNAGCECAVSPCKPQKWWNTIAPPACLSYIHPCRTCSPWGMSNLCILCLNTFSATTLNVWVKTFRRHSTNLSLC